VAVARTDVLLERLRESRLQQLVADVAERVISGPAVDLLGPAVLENAMTPLPISRTRIAAAARSRYWDWAGRASRASRDF
jgi:hypothetical protein